jgi:iron complex transport system ATP-binding protein
LQISIQDLSTGYGDNTIIRSLFIDLPCHAFIAVVGHNGAGKSTFLNALSNQITFQGQVIFPENHNKIAKLGQKNQINFSIPVKDLVVMGLFTQNKIFQSYGEPQLEQVMAVLAQNKILHLADKDFLSLSGGEQQLVWLSQMMLQQKDIYLFDEPTQYLDIAHTQLIFDKLQEMVTQHQKTVICITHHIHYLKGMDAYILNLSLPKPVLQKISSLVMEETIASLSSLGQ